MKDATVLRRVAHTRQTWGEEVRREREGQDLTLRDLAERAGLHFTTIGKIEQGRLEASLTVQIKIADALGVKRGALFPDTDGERREMAVA